MPWNNILLDVLLWAAVVYGTFAATIWFENRRMRRDRNLTVPPPQHVRTLEPADVDPNGRVHKLGVDRELSA